MNKDNITVRQLTGDDWKILKELRSESRDQPLGQLPEISSSFGQVAPVIGGEEPKHRGMVRHGFAAAEIEQRHNRSRWIDIRGQQARMLYQRIDEGAFARLDLTDDGDPAVGLLQLPLRFLKKGGSLLVDVFLQLDRQAQQAVANVFQGCADWWDFAGFTRAHARRWPIVPRQRRLEAHYLNVQGSPFPHAHPYWL